MSNFNLIKQRIVSFCITYKYPILIIAISFIFLLPLFESGFLVGHDNRPQVARIASRILAIQDGQFPIRWAGNLNYGYGHPGFIFFYSLSGYLGALFYFLGFSLENAYEILLGLTFILAPIFFYMWSSQLFQKRIAFVAALIYALSPYSFLDMYVRVHLGELASLALAPLVVFFIERNFKKISALNIIGGTVAYTLFIHSHSILSLIFTFIFFGYILFRSGFKKGLLLSNLGILALGLLSSFYFWAPALYEGKYINSKIFVTDWYKDHFLNFYNIIYSRWGFGSNVNEKGGLSAQIGPLHVTFVTLSLLLLKKLKYKSTVLFWIIVFILGIFMSTSLSDFLWNRIHLLQQFQFPWRFTAVSCFSASVLAGYVLTFFNNKKIEAISLVILLVLAFPMAKVWKNESKGNNYYFNYPGTGAYHNEATTVWVAGDAYQYPKNRVEIINGKGKISNYKRKSQLHSFNVNSDTEIKVLDNTVYFPGWRVEVDGKKVPIEFQDINHRGLITFDVQKGSHQVNVKFGESPVRFFADIVSVGTVFLVLMIFFFRKRMNIFLRAIK